MGLERKVILLQHCLRRQLEKLCRHIEKTESEFCEDTFRGFYPVLKIPPMTKEQKEQFIENYKNAMQSNSKQITIIDECKS